MAHVKLTEEKKRLYNERRQKTLMEKYGNPYYINSDKIRKTKEERYGDPNYNNQQKHKETCLEKYGVEHHNQTQEARENIRNKKLSEETQKLYEKTCLERYGVTNVNLSGEIMEKRRNTLLDRYGVENPLQNHDIKKKQLESLKENGSYAKSKIEEDVYSWLINKYGEENVIRQYWDERYPFNCDFYIKSEDLFIEVNNHPSHGDHPYDEKSEEDRLLLESLIEKGDDWSMMIVDVWSVRDPKKFMCAKKNNLNYKVIYKNIDEIVNE